jgi:hypothetical protein
MSSPDAVIEVVSAENKNSSGGWSRLGELSLLTNFTHRPEGFGNDPSLIQENLRDDLRKMSLLKQIEFFGAADG